ncbi:vacuolar protein sorting-associated VTA1-like protein [Ceratobasidium sp. AG-Ba]|nr:vacuolar protein sorting-associated VTA1-like protein [Ceratobasidium sp. AG-Ba]
MPLPPLPPELKAIAPFLQRADEMRGKDPVISFWCEYYAVKKGLSLRQSSESRSFLLQLMDSLEATKKALADREAINNDDAGHLYVENFADRIFIMADEEDRRGATARSTAKKFLAAGQFYDILSVFEGTKQTQGPKTSEKRTYAKWRATEISKAFRDNLPTDPNGSQTLTASSVSSLPPVGTSSTPPLPSARSPTAQSPTNIPTTITITSPGPGSGTASPGGSGSGTPSTTSFGRIGLDSNALGCGDKPSVDRVDRGLNEEDSSTDPGTEDDDSAAGSGGVNGSSRRLFNAPENGHEANGESWSNGAGWDVRQASLAVQPPESRQSSFAQRPADVSLPVSPPATGPMPQILGSPTSSNFSNGPPALISGPVAEPAIPQTPGKQSSPISSYSTPGRASPPSAPPPSVATPSSSHTSITPTGSPAATEDSPATTPTSGPTITVSGQQPTSLVLPPRRVHFRVRLLED